MDGSRCVVPAFSPKLALRVGPISLYWTLPSGFSTVRSRFKSTHARSSVCSPIGLYGEVEFNDSPATYLLTLPLIAVLPLPNRSCATPSRTAQSFQLGRSSIGVKLRAGTKRP